MTDALPPPNSREKKWKIKAEVDTVDVLLFDVADGVFSTLSNFFSVDDEYGNERLSLGFQDDKTT